MEVTQEVKFIHKIRIGNNIISLIDSKQRSEIYIIKYISENICAFERDKHNNELLFFKENQGGYRNGMSFWFSYPANIKTTLDHNSTDNEIAKEFIRIYKKTIKDNK
jgi:hypothetical protein